MKLTGMYTAAGAKLAAQAKAAEKPLMITRVAAGSGKTTGSALFLVQECQNLAIQGKAAEAGNCTLTVLLDAAQAPYNYTLKEVGVYAKMEGGAETFYKYFRLDESVYVEKNMDLTITFYLTESVMPADQVEVVVTQQGLITREICEQVSDAAAAVVNGALEEHKTDDGAHSALFAQKAPLSHTHPASHITAGTLAGQVAAQSNTDYTTPQVRSIILSTAEPSGGSNGQIWIKYTV